MAERETCLRMDGFVVAKVLTRAVAGAMRQHREIVPEWTDRSASSRCTKLAKGEGYCNVRKMVVVQASSP